jgi:hypothetical protein
VGTTRGQKAVPASHNTLPGHANQCLGLVAKRCFRHLQPMSYPPFHPSPRCRTRPLRPRLPLLAAILAVGLVPRGFPAVPDTPFRQPVSVRFVPAPELASATYRRLQVNRDGIPYLLTDRGVARPFDHRVALDRSFRPLAGRVARDLVNDAGNLFYLFDDSFLCNDLAGKYFLPLPPGQYRSAALLADGTGLLASPTNLLLVAGNQWKSLPFAVPRDTERLYAQSNQFFILAGNSIFRLAGPTAPELFHRGENLTALAFRGPELFVGTRQGYYVLDVASAKLTLVRQDRLPALDITCLLPTTNGLWAGTTQGVFFQTGSRWFRYYASKRWLPDDRVVDLALTPEGELYVLTAAGLARIDAPLTTLAQKADHYERKIRQRHIRYGFCSELRLLQPGDIASAEMIDTDNDGTWTSLYLASQAFRFGATGDETARARAWETFETLERLQAIHGLEGFPARSFERAGFRVSDPDRWRPALERHWDWKGHTSSDEVTAHTFAYAVLYEVATRTARERDRIAAAYDRILAHILRNNLQLVDADGLPTLWGRWNPEYVNHFPPSIADRRLNSTEIVAFLQFGHRITGKDLYKQAALDLLRNHAYLQNITNTMAAIRHTPGFVVQGHDMGDEWNHSDDQLAFLAYWPLYRYAFDDTLRHVYAAAIRDHWELEKTERNPLWNFVYSVTNPAQFDPQGALWTLQCFPIDLVSWTVRNAHRRDITLLPANFRRQVTAELLPADERPVMRWSGNPFLPDGGNDGHTEFAGEEFLLPYWMGRYLRIIQ